MSPEVLLSAMYLADENYIDTLNIHTDCVVINQCDRECERRTERITPFGPVRVKYIETTGRGLSRSRNTALSVAEDDVCILCDNDVEYVPDYDNIINDAFSKHPDADLIVFYVKRPEREKPLFDRPVRMRYLSVLKIFSPEIAFRRKSVDGIRFNLLFGAGARFFLGEENLFLYDCLKHGKKIIYMPKMIARVREEESTWFKGYDREFFISRGANFAALSTVFSPVLIMQFAVRKRSLYAENMSTAKAVAYMLRGRREYLKLRGRSVRKKA